MWDVQEMGATTVTVTEVVCGDEFYSCYCSQPAQHDGLHKCVCGGSWDGDYNPHSLPDITSFFGPVQPKPVEPPLG